MPITPQKINLRWSDLDPNFHMKHSSYYDIASQYRMDVLNQYQITLSAMEEQHFAPILLREECVFLREIRYNEIVTINFLINSVNEDGSKWQILHEFKDEKNKIKAKLTVDIAWFDIQKRKIATPLPKILEDGFEMMRKAAKE